MLPIKQIPESLNAVCIKQCIASHNLKKLAALQLFDSINSTNTYLIERAKLGAPSGLVCIADTQTKGRGRQASVWFSPRGANLYLSMVWHFPQYEASLSGLGLAVGVMVFQALQALQLPQGLVLKWPNDLIFLGNKLSGILVETVKAPEGSIAAIIGIGVNIALPQDVPESHWTDLVTLLQRPVSRNEVAGRILNALLEGLPRFEQAGFSAFKDTWCEHDALLGKRVNIMTVQQTVQGEMVGVGQQGELLLKDVNGCVSGYFSGEVSVRPADGYKKS